VSGAAVPGQPACNVPAARRPRRRRVVSSSNVARTSLRTSTDFEKSIRPPPKPKGELQLQVSARAAAARPGGARRLPAATGQQQRSTTAAGCGAVRPRGPRRAPARAPRRPSC
jgi:hypothetical protein